MANRHRFLRSAALRNLLILLVVWEIVGRLKLVAGGALPSVSAILTQLWADRADYPGHIWATVHASSLGFLIGNLLRACWPSGRASCSCCSRRCCG